MNEIFNRRDQTPKRQQLRNEAPPAERKLWAHLRGEQLGAKFRRQFSVERYVLDFYCPRLRLAIEVDGESHAGDEAQAYDAVRQSEIEALGIVFLRFSNQEIYRNAQSVAETIRLKVEELKAADLTSELPPFRLRPSPSAPVSTPSGLRASPPAPVPTASVLTPSGLRPSPPPGGGERTGTTGDERTDNRAAKSQRGLPLPEGEVAEGRRGSN